MALTFRLARARASMHRIGAVMLADLRVLSRGRWWWAFRFLFTVTLVIVVYAAWPRDSFDSMLEISRFGATLFQAFFITAYVATAFLTPPLFSGAIASEGKNPMIDILFTTPLPSWEIVAGKFLSHYAMLLQVLACGVPVLFSSLIFGGVSGAQTIFAGVSLLALGFFLGAASLYASVLSRKPYMAAFMVYLLGGILTVVAPQIFVVAGFILSTAGLPFSVGELTGLAAPQVALAFLPFDVPSLSTVFKWLYVSEALLFGLGLLAWSGRSLKPLDVKRTLSLARIRRRRLNRTVLYPPPPPVQRPMAPVPQAKRRCKPSRYRGPVWDNPVAWKEVVTDHGALGTILVVCGVALLAYLTLTALFLSLTLEQAATVGFLLQNGLVMGEILIVGLLAVTYAGTGMAREGVGGLMEILAATPLTSLEVFQGKFTGFMRTLAPLWIFFGIHTLATLFTSLIFTTPISALMTFLFPVYVLLFTVSCGSACLFLSLYGRTHSVGMIASLVLLLAWWIVPPVLISLIEMDGAAVAWGFNPFFAVAALNALVWPSIEGVNHGSAYGHFGPALPVAATFVFMALTAVFSVLGFSALYDRRMGRS